MKKQIILIECFYSLHVLLTLAIYPLLIAYAVLRRLGQWLRGQFCQPKSIVGEVALITGSGRGLGRDLAIALAQQGCHIAIVDIRGKLADETAAHIAQTYGVKTKSYQVDVSNYQQLLDLKESIAKDLGDVTILINNAAILYLSSVDNPPPQEVQRMINVNFMAAVFTTQIFLPMMKQLNRGHIVNISSMASSMPHPTANVYGASKAALRHLTSSLRIELLLSKSNVTATTVCPLFLTTHEGVNQLIKSMNTKHLFRKINGNVVAHYVIGAMLCGEDVVTVPRIYIWNERLMALLPACVVEKVSAIVSRGSSQIVNAAIPKIVKADEMPITLS